MLQQETPGDFVLATGKTHTVREFADLTFKLLDMPLEWSGVGPAERGIDRKTGNVLVEIDPRYYRPTEVEILMGDATKAREKLGWAPTTVFEDLVAMMVKADFERVTKRGY